VQAPHPLSPHLDFVLVNSGPRDRMKSRSVVSGSIVPSIELDESPLKMKEDRVCTDSEFGERVDR
jgi:hypothetical protein